MTPPAGPNRRLWLLLALLLLGYFAAFAVYPGMFFALGVNHYDAWFLDTFALLASNDAIARVGSVSIFTMRPRSAAYR